MQFRKKRPVLDLLISSALVHELESSGLTIEELIVRGVRMLGAYRAARRAGYLHIGFVHNRLQLDIPYLGPTL